MGKLKDIWNNFFNKKAIKNQVEVIEEPIHFEIVEENSKETTINTPVAIIKFTEVDNTIEPLKKVPVKKIPVKKAAAKKINSKKKK